MEPIALGHVRNYLSCSFLFARECVRQQETNILFSGGKYKISPRETKGVFEIIISAQAS
jgi:hypothetical protein